MRTERRSFLGRTGLAVAASVVVGIAALRAAPPVVEETLPCAKEEENLNRPEVELELDYVGKYVSRGVVLNEDPTLQPAVSVSWFGFTAGFWGNVDTTDAHGRDGDFTEEDFFFCYSYTLGPVTAEAGLIYYDFPTASPRVSKEWYGKLACEDWPLAPAITAYYDWDEANGVYINPTLTQSIPLVKDRLALVAEGGVGWGNRNFNEFNMGRYQSGWTDVTAKLSLEWTVVEHVQIAPFVAWSEVIDHELEDYVEADPDGDEAGLGQHSEQYWGGVSLRACF